MHPYQIVRAGTPLGQSGHALILLHGRGGSPRDMIALGQRFVQGDWHLAAPQAAGSTWYPYGFMEERDRNSPWLESALDVVHRLIGEIKHHLPADHIHIMGFSQGACLATDSVARLPQHYGGVYAFTGGLIGKDLDPSAYQGDMAGTPVYLSNSDDDPHVPLSRSKETLRILEGMNARVTLDVFPGRSHTIDQQEIERARDLMRATV